MAIKPKLKYNTKKARTTTEFKNLYGALGEQINLAEATKIIEHQERGHAEHPEGEGEYPEGATTPQEAQAIYGGQVEGEYPLPTARTPEEQATETPFISPEQAKLEPETVEDINVPTVVKPEASMLAGLTGGTPRHDILRINYARR